MNVPPNGRSASAIDDGLALINHVKALPYVDGSRISSLEALERAVAFVKAEKPDAR